MQPTTTNCCSRKERTIMKFIMRLKAMIWTILFVAVISTSIFHAWDVVKDTYLHINQPTVPYVETHEFWIPPNTKIISEEEMIKLTRTAKYIASERTGLNLEDFKNLSEGLNVYIWIKKSSNASVQYLGMKNNAAVFIDVKYTQKKNTGDLTPKITFGDQRIHISWVKGQDKFVGRLIISVFLAFCTLIFTAVATIIGYYVLLCWWNPWKYGWPRQWKIKYPTA